MRKTTEVSTACLDVTLQVNAAWVRQTPRHTTRVRARASSLQTAAVTNAGTARAAGVADAGTIEDSALEGETLMLCSDIISVDQELRSRPDFDTTAYVMGQAIAHTQRWCVAQGTLIRAFRSVEVLRMVQPGLPASFLFIFEAILA